MNEHVRNKFLTTCTDCGQRTSRRYATRHIGKCKTCAEGPERTSSRNALIIDAGYDAYVLIIDAGYDAYAREDGHYDLPDNA